MITQNSDDKITITFSVKRLSSIWNGMITRCYNKKTDAYKNYGGRGVFVCDKWKNSFSEFAWWSVRSGYSDELQLDRIDNNLGYGPNNCRFTTATENNNNKRNNVKINYEGKFLTLSQFSTKTGINRHTIKYRLDAGYSIEECIKESLGSSSLKNISIRKSGNFRVVIQKNGIKLLNKTFGNLGDAIKARDYILETKENICLE